MKKFKKLIPALCMLLISAVLMGTSTYAWFSMNKTVKAEGMQVTAQTNNYYLLIGNDETVTTIQTNKKTSESAKQITTNNGNKVYPAMYGDGTTLGNVTTEAGKWYTANNSNIDNATNAITNARVLENNELGQYVIEYNLWLTLAKGSTAVTDKTITVTFKRGDNVDVSISAVVVIGTTNALVFDHTKVATGDETKTHPTATSSAISLSDTEAVQVKVYVYVDGNADNVNTAYLNGGNTLTGTIELLFTVND